MAMIYRASVSRPELWNRNICCSCSGVIRNVYNRNCVGIRTSLYKPAALSSLRLQPKSFQTGRLCYNNMESGRRSSRRIIRSEAPPSGPEKKNKDSKGLTSLELGKSGSSKTKNSYNGIFFLLLLNLGIYALDHWLHFPGIRLLYLYHDDPRWYQFITSTFCHISWTHLSSNLFFLYIFGKLVEEEEGGLAVWLSYLMTGVGANVVSWLLLPRTVISAGASGAVFGLFAISVLVKMSFNWRKILEVLILGQFVVEKVMEEAQASARLGDFAFKGSMNINHIAHLSGALVGVALICLLNRLPSGDLEKK